MSDNLSDNIEFSKMLTPQTDTKIWAVGGGKGGVGKSMVTANISICLALMGYRVVTIDLDLGGANLHTCLGVSIPDKTLSDYLSKKVPYLNDLLTPTHIKNLSIISGAQDDLGIANLKHMQKHKLISKLSQLDADYILLDLGAGTTFNTLDFFITANEGILTCLPEPTAIENTYRFIKSIFHRKLKMAGDLFQISPLIDQVLNAKMSESAAPIDLIGRIMEINEEKGRKIENLIKQLRPKLIVNQVRTQADIDIGHSMELICRKYFGIELEFTGYLEYDATVWQSVKKRKPLLMEFPNSNLVKNFDNIMNNLLKV